MSSTNPFRRVLIENSFNIAAGTGVLIEWEIEKWFVETGPWEFIVERSARPDDGWVEVARTTDRSWVYDVTAREVGLEVSNYYRVVLVSAENRYTSDVSLAGNASAGYEWRITRDLVRKHVKIFNNHRGGGSTRGFLLRLPTFGEPSTNVDPNTGEVIDPMNAEDQGTGYVGGYWPPLEVFLRINPEKLITRLTAEQGVINGVNTTALALAFPRVRAKDIWVNAVTDERYRIGGEIATTMGMGGTPIVQQLVLERLAPSHVVYTVKVPRG